MPVEFRERYQSQLQSEEGAALFGLSSDSEVRERPIKCLALVSFVMSQ
jgi:hypothetical protein